VKSELQPSFPDFERLAREGDLVPVWRELFSDIDTPVSAFLKLPSRERAFLLESVEGGERWGRYSFLADRPVATLTVRGDEVRVEPEEAALRLLGSAGVGSAGVGSAGVGSAGRVGSAGVSPAQSAIAGSGGPLGSAGVSPAPSITVPRGLNGIAALRALLGKRRLVHPAGLPPFIGGLVGYLSWAAVRWFEPTVPQRLGEDKDFPDAEWMLVDRLIAFDNLSHRIQLIALADLKAAPSARAAYERAAESVDELAAALSRGIAAPAEPPSITDIADGWSGEGFKDAVRRTREYIRAGDCFQVVLSRRLNARYGGEPFELYRRLRASAPTPFLFYLRFGPRALAGASPEVLVRVHDGQVIVRPIAGTRRRGSSPAEDSALERELRADPKELAEHVMLVDLGRNDVGRVAAPSSVRVEEREVIERYSHVMHLVSQVSGRLATGRDVIDAIASTFPAGTVSGAPKVRAMQIIDELEPVPRGPYAGAAGYIGFDGRTDLAINIRALALSGDRLRLQAGAGIVFDSDPQRELEETSHKLGAPLAALGAIDPAAGARR
jgi:anthranilate synthase component 1